MSKYRQMIMSLVLAGMLLLNLPGAAAGAIPEPVTAEATPQLLAADVTPQPVAAKVAFQPTASGTRIVSVRTEVTVRNPTPEVVKNLVITLPPTVASQVGQQRVLDVQFSTPPTAKRETTVGTEVTYQVPEMAAGATLVFEQVYTVELAPNGSGVVQERGGSRDLIAEPGIEVDHPVIQAMAQAAVKGVTGADAQAEALVRAVVDRLEYDAAAPSRNQGALAGYRSGYGVCQEYASLFVALSRAAGLPARLVYGWAKDTGLTSQLTNENRHVWAQYYHPERGWVSVDPTFAEQQDDLLFFDPAAHIAQDYANATMKASFGGRGVVSINTLQSLADVTR